MADGKIYWSSECPKCSDDAVEITEYQMMLLKKCKGVRKDGFQT